MHTCGSLTEYRVLADFKLASEPGNDRVAAERVGHIVAQLAIAPARVERLRTAVAEATLNAIEHGNHFAADKLVGVRVEASSSDLCVTVSDEGGGRRGRSSAAPDLQAKLRGEQSPRGWGVFLIRNMVDDCSDESDSRGHRVHLRLRL